MQTTSSFRKHSGRYEEKRDSSPKKDMSFVWITDAKTIVSAVRIMMDFPHGIQQEELFMLMNLQADDRETLKSLFQEKDVFVGHNIAGQKRIKFSLSFEDYLSKMKSRHEYSDLIEKYDIKSSGTSVKQLKGLSESDLDQTLLMDIDAEFKLNGRLPEILKMCCEVLVGEKQGSGDTEMKDDFTPNQPGKSDETSEKDDNIMQSTDRQESMECREDEEKEEKSISLEDVSTYLGYIKVQQGAQISDLISCTEKEFNIQGLVQKLDDMCKNCKKEGQPTVCTVDVTYDAFLEMMESQSIHFDERLLAAIQEAFRVDKERLFCGLRRVCQNLKEKKPHSV